METPFAEIALTIIVILGSAKLLAVLLERGGQSAVVTRWAVGVGMMPRGEVGFIFALFGLVNGILTPEWYAILVMIVLITTIATPGILRSLLTRAS